MKNSQKINFSLILSFFTTHKTNLIKSGENRNLYSFINIEKNGGKNKSTKMHKTKNGIFAFDWPWHGSNILQKFYYNKKLRTVKYVSKITSD